MKPQLTSSDFEAAAKTMRRVKLKCVAILEMRATLEAAGRTMSAADEAALLSSVDASITKSKKAVKAMDAIGDATEALGAPQA